MTPLNLKRKVLLFVAVTVAALFVGYWYVSSSYLQRQEAQFFDERKRLADAIASEFTGFFSRGVQRLQLVAALPALVYGLGSLEETREDKQQLPMWTSLHYLLYEHEVFTSGIYLVNAQGKVLWSEPPDSDLLDTDFAAYQNVAESLGNPPADITFVVSEKPEPEILVGTPVIDGEGRAAGLLIGAIPASHPTLQTMLLANPISNGTTQLVDESGRIIASTDPSRAMRKFNYEDPTQPVVVASQVSPAPWSIIIDQNPTEALAGIQSLKTLLAAYGAIFLVIAMASLLFILRSFTRPVELLTEAARRIGDGDLTGGFTLDRNDEIGVLAKTLDDMKTKLKASYDLLLQSEKMALMGQIVAGIAHELNNPLTVVIGNVQLLMMREVNEKNLQSLSRIKDGSERASKIVKNLLTFARQDRPERHATDVNTVLKKALELRAYEMKVNNIEVSTDFAANLPETMADPHQLQQVFLNLIVNAEQAMLDAHGKGLLRLTTRLEGRRILVYFSDDGPGIPPEKLRRIFEPFFTTKPVGKGTGLGLSICQGIMGEHDGRIDVESTVGRGSTFIVDIPVQRWKPVPAPAPEPARPSMSVRKKILVVEDELHIRQLLEDIVRALGHDVHTADNGRAALELIDQNKFDLIVTDVKMPEISGPDFYAELKRKGEALEQRVIFVTGDLMNPETLQFIESTGRAWLGKPFDIASISRTISECLNAVGKIPV